MPHAALSVSVPEDVWLQDVSTAHPDATFRVVAVLASEASAIALVELRTPDPLAVLTDVDGRDDVADVDLLRTHEASALLQVETTSAPLLAPVWEAGVPLELPFAVVDGEATWTLRTSSARFAALGEALDAAGVDYAVEFVSDLGGDRADRLLTDRQREVLRAAIAAGYYATPREATLTEVAADLGIAKSTCSDVLHRAEGSVLAWFVDQHLGGGQGVGAT